DIPTPRPAGRRHPQRHDGGHMEAYILGVGLHRRVAGTLFDGLKQKRLLATRCSRSGLSYLPPRTHCERPFEPCEGRVEAGREGTIEAATIVTAAFEHSPPPPYAIAYVRLDGISTARLNFVRGLDVTDVVAAAGRLKPGARVRVDFVERPQGRVTDCD
ncbi:MAG: Zn-ribbon domain-containing OB-fold protein, partial [Candidatus Methylomirabilia bacterium]